MSLRGRIVKLESRSKLRLPALSQEEIDSRADAAIARRGWTWEQVASWNFPPNLKALRMTDAELLMILEGTS